MRARRVRSLRRAAICDAPMTRYVPDTLDCKIIDMLRHEARISNRQIASVLQVTEGTVRARIKWLQTAGLLRFSVVKNLAAAGSPRLTMIGIEADPVCVHDLAATLSAMPEIGGVLVLLGRYSVLAMGLFPSLAGADRFVRTSILSLPGVRHAETAISMRHVKSEISIGRITSRAPC